MTCGGVCHAYLCASNWIGLWPAWYCWTQDRVPLGIIILTSVVMSSVFHAAESSALHGLPGVPLFNTLPMWFLSASDRMLAAAMIITVISQHFYWDRSRLEAWLRAEPLLPGAALTFWVLGELLSCHWFHFLGMDAWCEPFHYTLFHSGYHVMAYLSILRAIQHALTTHPIPPKSETKTI